MAVAEGFQFQDTLTGFKWIGNKAIDLKNHGCHVPFAYEEAIGYMFDVVNDKDGIAAAVVWLQLYKAWAGDAGASGATLILEKLEQGYKKYGYFKECNGYYKLKDLGKTEEIFREIRAGYDEVPARLGEFEVIYWRDLTRGYESGTEDGRLVLPQDENSQMITAVLSASASGTSAGTSSGTSSSTSGASTGSSSSSTTGRASGPSDASGTSTVRFTCRGSGTEPKLKVYIEGKASDEATAKALARRCWDTLKREWFQPEKNELEEVLN